MNRYSLKWTELNISNSNIIRIFVPLINQFMFQQNTNIALIVDATSFTGLVDKPSMLGAFLFNNMKTIQLTRGKEAQVSDRDYEFLNSFKWQAHLNSTSGRWYAASSTNKKFMHRLILGITDHKILCDHKDGNGLNNQRENLRIATHSQNMANRKKAKNSTSQYLGVHKTQRWSVVHWMAAVQRDKKVLRSPQFPFTSAGEILAAKWYNEKAILIHGEFARLNIIKENEPA